MKRTTTGIACIDQKAKEQQEASDNFWNITPPDESQDKGFKP